MFCILLLIHFVHYHYSGLSIRSRQESRAGVVPKVSEACKYANKPLSQTLLSCESRFKALMWGAPLAPFAHKHWAQNSKGLSSPCPGCLLLFPGARRVKSPHFPHWRTTPCYFLMQNKGNNDCNNKFGIEPHSFFHHFASLSLTGSFLFWILSGFGESWSLRCP